MGFSSGVEAELGELRAFLHARVYRHARIATVMSRAQSIITALLERYIATPDALPEKWQARAAGTDEFGFARHVANFIAGMTDRYALAEHARLFDDTPELR